MKCVLSKFGEEILTKQDIEGVSLLHGGIWEV